MSDPSTEQLLQEEEYIIPYPFLIRGDRLIAFPDKLFVTCDYVEKMRRVFEILPPTQGDRLLDVACGVGRLAAELDKRNVPDVEYLGGDYSERAVAMARVLNPGHHFQVVDITAGTEFADNFFDKLISIETLEHIPPPKLPQVVDELYRVMKPGGRGLVTVPHRNRPKDRKHYQHFDVDSLSDTLGKRFEIVRMYGFHSAGWWRNVPLRILTGLYYALYPCTKLGLNAVPKGINHLAYGYFRNSVRQCGPDQGLSLLCEIRKAP